MASTIHAVRGMNDVLPEATAAWQQLERVARDTFAQYGYREIRLPLLERTELFKRSIGEFTDKTYSTTGEVLSPEAYAKHLEETLPTAAVKAKLAELYKQPDWVLPV